MAEQMSTPRITAPYLDNFVGRVIMLVGKVTQLRGEQATLDSDGTVTVLLNRDAHLANGNSVQVIGKVNPDLTIKVLTSRDLGNSVDHGPSQSQAYTPRVAMVWTSPEESRTLSSPSHQQQASYDERNANSNTISPGSPSTSTIRSSRPAREAYAAAQRLQRTTHEYSRPSTSMSFTTSSSDRILGRSFESRSPSPSPSYISRTPTPTPPQPLLQSLPSPPEDDGYPSYSTDRSQTSALTPQSNQGQQTSQPSYQQTSQQSSQSIPSAQPYTPVAPLSPQSISSPSLLPSPPMTQPRDDPFQTSYPAPVPAISLLSPRRHPRPAAHRFPAGPSTTTPNLNDPDSALLDSVVEGIGRIHVTMGRDDAGRWRIKRPPDMRS